MRRALAITAASVAAVGILILFAFHITPSAVQKRQMFRADLHHTGVYDSKSVPKIWDMLRQLQMSKVRGVTYPDAARLVRR